MSSAEITPITLYLGQLCPLHRNIKGCDQKKMLRNAESVTNRQ